MKLRVESAGKSLFEIYKLRSYFQCGIHIDRQRNSKEFIVPYKVDEHSIDEQLEFYMSKMPMKFTAMPLNLVFDLQLKTNTKLNMYKDDTSLIDSQTEVEKPEFHSVTFEGLIGMYSNKVNDMVRMRNMYRKQKTLLLEGKLADVKEWYISNIDGWMEDTSSKTTEK